MPACPECESPLDVDEEEVDEGEVVLCDECGSEFEVVSVDPLELHKVEEAAYVEEENSEFLEEEEE